MNYPPPGGAPLYSMLAPHQQQPPLSQRADAKKCIFDYTCECGLKFLYQGELKDHYFKCEPMKQRYGELFQMIVKYNHKGLSIPQKMSLNAVIDMFSNEIKTVVINDMKRQGLPTAQYSDPVQHAGPCASCLQNKGDVRASQVFGQPLPQQMMMPNQIHQAPPQQQPMPPMMVNPILQQQQQPNPKPVYVPEPKPIDLMMPQPQLGKQPSGLMMPPNNGGGGLQMPVGHENAMMH